MSLVAELELERGSFRLRAALEARAGEVTAVFGASGCGKTTLLEALAGLRGARGLCRLGERVWLDSGRGVHVPAHRRGAVLVFQDARLFDHLDVAANLAYAARRSGARQRTREVVALLGLEPLLGRRPGDLSGGERQRVALGRALLAQPRALLLDEPLASLDAARKQEVLPALEAVARRSHVPVVLVTHSLEEVARLADRIVLMEEGRTGESGPVPGMLTRLDLPLAHRDDGGAVLHAELEGHDPRWHVSTLRLAEQRLRVPTVPGRPGEALRLRVAARDVSLALDRPARTSLLNVLAGRVCASAPDREGQRLVRLEVDGQPLVARISELSVRELGLRPGREVFVQIKGVALA